MLSTKQDVRDLFLLYSTRPKKFIYTSMNHLKSYTIFNEAVHYNGYTVIDGRMIGTGVKKEKFHENLKELAELHNIPDLPHKFELIEDHFLPFDKCTVRYNITPIKNGNRFFVVTVDMAKNFDPRILDEDRIRKCHPNFEIFKNARMDYDKGLVDGHYAYIKFYI